MTVWISELGFVMGQLDHGRRDRSIHFNSHGPHGVKKNCFYGALVKSDLDAVKSICDKRGESWLPRKGSVRWAQSHLAHDLFAITCVIKTNESERSWIGTYLNASRGTRVVECLHRTGKRHTQ